MSTRNAKPVDQALAKSQAPAEGSYIVTSGFSDISAERITSDATLKS